MAVPRPLSDLDAPAELTDNDALYVVVDGESKQAPASLVKDYVDVGAAIATHTADVDPHGDRAYTDTELTAHEAAADPHPVYAPKASPAFTGTPTAPLLSLDVLDPSGARYAIQQKTGTFESGLYQDTTMNIGYNVSTTPGVKVVPTEPMLFAQWESKFRNGPGSPYGSEFHFNFQRPGVSSGLARPISMFMEHDSDTMDVALTADVFSVATSAGDQVINSSANAVFMHQNLSVEAAQMTLGTSTVPGTNATLIINAGSGVSNHQIQFKQAAVHKWWFYNAGGDNMYFRDMVNAKMHLTLVPGATVAAALTLIGSSLRVDGDVGFYGTTPIAKQTGVAVDAAAIHAALVNLGLIAA